MLLDTVLGGRLLTSDLRGSLDIISTTSHKKSTERLSNLLNATQQITQWVNRASCFTDCNLQTVRKIKMNAYNLIHLLDFVPNIKFFIFHLLRNYLKGKAHFYRL